MEAKDIIMVTKVIADVIFMAFESHLRNAHNMSENEVLSFMTLMNNDLRKDFSKAIMKDFIEREDDGKNTQ